METVASRATGMELSEIGLGCMSFGISGEREWTLDADTSREIIERAIDLGINFFDTANVYSAGDSERILGEVVSDYDRDRFVIGTKVYNQTDPENPNSLGLSRKAIEQELQKSLDRLRMETIDLYQTHRWDYETPIEETLRTFDDAIRRGDVRYIGGSSMWAYQFAKSLYKSDLLGVERFSTMQNHYNLVYREEEREMLPLCRSEGVDVFPWSPLARGYLTRPHEEFDTTNRGQEESETKEDRHAIYRAGGGEEVNERVQELAAEKDVSMSQIALAWQLHKDVVTAPIVGVSSVEHLEEAVAATDISLSRSDIEYLEEPYSPVAITGHD